MSTPLYHNQPPAGSPADGQLPLFDAAPDPSGCYYLAFTRGHDETDAAAVFLRRYGQPPRYIIENLGLLLVGPVPGLTERIRGTMTPMTPSDEIRKVLGAMTREMAMIWSNAGFTAEIVSAVNNGGSDNALLDLLQRAYNKSWWWPMPANDLAKAILLKEGAL